MLLVSTTRLRGLSRVGLTRIVGYRGYASDAEFKIPVIDFSKFRKAENAASLRREAADEIVTAFKEVGFIYLKNHGIEGDTVKRAFQLSKEFFELPLEEKQKLAWKDPRANRGYVAPGRERVTQSTNPDEIASLRQRAPDSKETMEIGLESPTSLFPNEWPPSSLLPTFKPFFIEFWESCHLLHVDVMRSVALGLGMEEGWFDGRVGGRYHNLRLLSYPPIKTDLLRKDGQARAGAHSDYGSLTFVFQDQVGGLEVQNPHTKQYHPATPIPGTIVVNVGDLLQRWSNDVLRSTLHRVVAPRPKAGQADMSMTPHRQSIAFFCNPSGDAIIETLPTCHGNGVPKKYPAIRTDEYIVQRLKDTYT